ncbi:hypothetical protein CLU81_4944 [Flavobacterium sp. 9]|uniref:hypothetical protein n=1 Tax=Flavobacterium sp. 9 TaxID=2035198 RepID=UPI000C1A1AC7|nr:hypothetical protein [Flavobacterium sp. 9]PIF34306.1 hypothetical protein CLU81_4944 [Flavobacterium sp. 9]
MKKLLYVIFASFIFITFFSCTEKNTIKKLDKKTSVSALIHQNTENHPILLLIKNDKCDACKIFYKYFDANFEALVLPKLPEDTRVYQISINDFNSKNMWLFHVLEGYSFPTVLYLDKNNNIKNIHKGADLYAFSSFLDKINQEETKEFISRDLEKKSTLLKSYIALEEDHFISKSNFKEISKINHESPGFMSALLEGYYYKYNKIHVDRIFYIKEILQKSLNSSNQYFKIHENLVKEL